MVKIKPNYILKEVMGSYMVIPVDASSSSHMQTLNDTGAFLWNLLQEDCSEDSLLEKMLAEYDIDTETAKNDISIFVQKLKDAGLLEY